jgi:two-component system sensor histidine kinase HydH
LLAVYFGAAFAALGLLAGWIAEGRRRERGQATDMAALRARLGQSEKLAVLGQLATAIAHEVRNPLAVIRSAAQDLGEAPGTAGTAPRTCRFIVEETDRLAHVVNALLAFARPIAVAPRPTLLPDLCDRATLLARDAFDTKAVRLVRGTVPAVLITADPDLLCQVLLGLLDNGADAAGAGGEVTIDARTVDGQVEMAVSDTGPGIPSALRERVFEPFFTTRPHGTGLGLAVAKQIVEAHGGRIAVGDRVGGGARFTVAVPA